MIPDVSVIVFSTNLLRLSSLLKTVFRYNTDIWFQITKLKHTKFLQVKPKRQKEQSHQQEAGMGSTIFISQFTYNNKVLQYLLISAGRAFYSTYTGIPQS